MDRGYFKLNYYTFKKDMDFAESVVVDVPNYNTDMKSRRGTQRLVRGRGREGLFVAAAVTLSVLLGGVAGDKVLRTYFGD